MHDAALNRADPRPGVQPAAVRLNLHGATARLLSEAREVQRRQQQASTRVEHSPKSIIPCRAALGRRRARRRLALLPLVRGFFRAIYSVPLPPGGVPRSELEASGSRVPPAGGEALGRLGSGLPAVRE